MLICTVGYANNYEVPLTNGDFVIVSQLAEVRLQANLHFQSVRVKAIASEIEYELLLSLDILYGDFDKSLMMDFIRRMK